MQASAAESRPSAWPASVPALVALALLVVPTYAGLWNTLWNQDSYEYGPVMVAIFWWLVWRQRDALATMRPQPALIAGGTLLLCGLLLYYTGRAVAIPTFEMAAHVPVIVGLLLLLLGWAAVRRLWFALVFLVFTVPLPGFVIMAMTSQLKEWVSVVAESMLYHAGYPIARDGVVITIGQYPMLVADACSGLNSLYTLSAMGMLYIHLSYTPGWTRNALLLAAIVPMAVVANIVRVIALMLLTYHSGYDAGQGFMHGASGVLLFVVALAGLLGLDKVLRGWRREP